MGGQGPRCPNPRDMAPDPRDMVPGSSGGDFEPAAGRTGGQGPRWFKLQTGAHCSDSRSEVRGGSATRGGTNRFTVGHIPGGEILRGFCNGASTTVRRHGPTRARASRLASQPASQPGSQPTSQQASQSPRQAGSRPARSARATHAREAPAQLGFSTEIRAPRAQRSTRAPPPSFSTV